MTLPSSGAISLAQVAYELNLPNAGINLDHAWVRKLAQVGANPAAVSLANLQGKSGRFDGPLLAAAMPVGQQGPNSVVIGANASPAISLPFFGSVITQIAALTDPTYGTPAVASLTISPAWSGLILVKNTTTGVSVLMNTLVASGSWSNGPGSPGYPANWLRAGFTDNFTILIN